MLFFVRRNIIADSSDMNTVLGKISAPEFFIILRF